jgi:hypothetical protein
MSLRRVETGALVRSPEIVTEKSLKPTMALPASSSRTSRSIPALSSENQEKSPVARSAAASAGVASDAAGVVRGAGSEARPDSPQAAIPREARSHGPARSRSGDAEGEEMDLGLLLQILLRPVSGARRGHGADNSDMITRGTDPLRVVRT